MAATLREYLVSLGAEVDQKSFNKFKTALAGSAKTVTAFAGVLATMTAVLVKTSVSLDKTSQDYEQMARKAKKTTEEIRAQETALKVLGKTMADIKADKQLKAQYDNLVKLGKQMALPEAQGGLLTLRNVIQTVNELRVVGTYAMQWINYHMLNRIKAPLEEIYKGLDKFKTNLKNNLPSWTSKIGDALGSFLRLVMAGAKGVGDLLGLINKLPPGIKAIGTAISTTFTMAKIGPVGWILAGLTSILLLLDDFYTYKRGGKSALGDLWKSFEEGTAPEYLKEKLGGALEQFTSFGNDICERIKKSLIDFDWDGAGVKVGTIFTNLFAKLTGALSGTGEGFDLAKNTLSVVTTLFQGLATAIGSFLSSTEWGTMLEGALDAGGSFLLNVFDIIFGNGKGTEAEEGLASSASGILTKIITGLTEGISKISPERLGSKTGGLVTTIFQKIGELFKQDENGGSPLKTVLGAGFTLIETAANTIMDFLLNTLASIKFDDVGSSIGTVISSVLNLITTGLSRAVTALTGSGDKQGLAGKLLDFLRGLLSGFGTLISNISFDEIGADIGGFISGLFDKIGSFLKKEADKAARGDSLLGGLADTLYKIASGVVSLIGSALNEIDPDGVKELAYNLFEAIKNSLTDLASRITSGEIDLSELGANIGTGIGNAIKIGFDFIKTFLSDALQWVTGEEGKSTLIAIGSAIVEGIVAGLSGLGDTIGEAIFGKEQWEQWKDDSKNAQAVHSGEIQSDDYPQAELMRIATEDPEKFAEIKAKSQDWTNFMRSTNDAYGFPNATALNAGWNMDDLMKNKLIGAMSPIFHAKENDWWNDLVTQRNNAVKNQDKDQYESAVSGMKAFVDAWNKGLRGSDLLSAYTGWSGGHGTASEVSSMNREREKVQEYLSQKGMDIDLSTNAQISIDQLKELQQQVSELDGKTAETTIVINHVTKYSTVGGGDAGGATASGTGGSTTAPEKQAHGGFFGKPTEVIVGDDGDEAIIPMTNPSRAKALLQQMFARMGSASRDILASLGASSGSIGVGGPGMPAALQPAGMYPVASGGAITTNSGNTVSAPTTINVYGSSDPIATGNAAAKASESNIIRRVRGCFE